MARLVYAAITSLDGYVADEQGNFDWSAPDEEVHRFVNGLERGIGTHLLGRRMYEVLRVWDAFGTGADDPDAIREYGELWRDADKIVFSTSLDAVSTARTRLERRFDPEAVADLKEHSNRDISIGGPALAAQALAAGVIDAIHLLLSPVIVGGGNAALPNDLRLDLELLDERRFGNGVVHLHYAVAGTP